MQKNIDDDLICHIPFGALAKALGWSEVYLQASAMALDINNKTSGFSIQDVVALIQNSAVSKSAQDAFLSDLIKSKKLAQARELELAVALEIVKNDRSSAREQIEFLNQQLARAHARGDRLEKKIHDLTASLAHIVSQRDQLVARSQLKSKATTKVQNGREVLYLEEPICFGALEIDR